MFFLKPFFILEMLLASFPTLFQLCIKLLSIPNTILHCFTQGSTDVLVILFCHVLACFAIVLDTTCWTVIEIYRFRDRGGVGAGRAIPTTFLLPKIPLLKSSHPKYFPNFPTPKKSPNRTFQTQENPSMILKFRSKTQWIGSVQPEKFRKNGSTF